MISRAHGLWNPKDADHDKAEVSTWTVVTEASCVRPWLTCDIVWTGSFCRGWARFRGDLRSGTINGALIKPGYFLALLRELLHVPRGLTESAEAKKVRKKIQTGMGLYQIKKKGPTLTRKMDHHVSNPRSFWFRFRGVQVHPHHWTM